MCISFERPLLIQQFDEMFLSTLNAMILRHAGQNHNYSVLTQMKLGTQLLHFVSQFAVSARLAVYLFLPTGLDANVISPFDTFYV